MDSSDLPYITEQFDIAMKALVGRGDIKDRLLSAGLTLIAVFPHDLPEQIREDHRALLERLTEVSLEDPDHQGTLSATVEALSDEEAEDLARKIYELSKRLQQILRGPI